MSLGETSFRYAAAHLSCPLVAERGRSQLEGEVCKGSDILFPYMLCI
jgi:hypothetical protein